MNRAPSEAGLGAVLLRAALPPAAVVALHGISSFLGAYGRFPALDIPMHLAGGAAIAYSSRLLLGLCEMRCLLAIRREWLRALMLLSAVASAATVWEFVEFVSDRFVGTNAQRSLEDTLADMCLGIAGGAAWIAASARWGDRNGR